MSSKNKYHAHTQTSYKNLKFIVIPLILIALAVILVIVSTRNDSPGTTISTSPAQQIPQDQTTDWNTLSNEYGWSIKYPHDWEISADDDVDPEIAEAPVIQSPESCYTNGMHCGTFQIDTNPSQGTTYKDLSPKDYLLTIALKNGNNKVLLEQHSLLLSGISSYEITYKQTNATTEIYKEIALKYKDKIVDISYSEESKEGITSPQDWVLDPEFNAMLASLTFH